MSYRSYKSKRRAEIEKKCAAMRAAKARRRIESPEPVRQPTWTPPDLRRLVILIDFDTGRPIARTLALHRSDRIDCYEARVRGQVWKRRIGWSRVQAALRLALPRVTAP